MSKVTSKLQVTLPKVLAEQLGIKPGDEIDWEIAGDVMRVIPAAKKQRGREKRRLIAPTASFRSGHPSAKTAREIA